MAGTIRAVYDALPNFPATDQHPDAVRYQVGSKWVDAIGGQPTQQEIDALFLRFSDDRSIESRRVRTTNGTPAELFRAPVPANTAYKAVLTVWGITPDLAHFRMVEATVVVGRAAGAVAIVQTRVSPANATIRADHAIGNGGTWPLPTIAVDNTAPGGNQRRDVVISVTGVAATTIDWLLTGSYETFTPGGA